MDGTAITSQLSQWPVPGKWVSFYLAWQVGNCLECLCGHFCRAHPLQGWNWFSHKEFKLSRQGMVKWTSPNWSPPHIIVWVLATGALETPRFWPFSAFFGITFLKSPIPLLLLYQRHRIFFIILAPGFSEVGTHQAQPGCCLPTLAHSAGSTCLSIVTSLISSHLISCLCRELGI